jgi:hypothetical protein
MAPVICVAVSQPLGRAILNNGSLRGKYRVNADEMQLVDDATAEIGPNDCVYPLKKFRPRLPISVHTGHKLKLRSN